MTANTKQLKELVDLLIENNLDELLIEDKELKVHLKRNTEKPVVAMPQPVQAVQQPVSAAVPVATNEDVIDDSKALKAPMVGTFYLKPSPSSPVFVKVGDTVKAGQEICIIEAMKTMNRIEANKDGVVKSILVEDGQAVEFDEPLFIID